MKSLVLTAWVSIIYLLDTVGNLLAPLSGTVDWQMVGWAFAGSTSFVVYEAIQTKPPQRKGWHRVAMISLGMLISLGFNSWVTDRLGIPPIPCTILLGMAGYKLYGWLQKKADKPEKAIKDLTDLKP
ncbi:hypothetical protein EXU85_20405 [Spirosoma sp. KCTC 42546]|uniref:hypothetical protein n=1 Tax=Spirosoma sp. KCTC 42546 TaxID=2520506 RepID=UPI00115B2E13|nr:hypothetical protein [Spirosoma sp. KCTC 42546]QDK80842.1 hypothetical protein EXU85_20405 [Spirosoma sp. KCTC 42546]